ncbi:MAG: NUDIX hydrolase [Clostridia bacterium]|nr:NUDIX hydrolase [Clostridia bacterium]
MAHTHLIEIPKEREEIFQGRVLHVVRDTVILPNGSESTREVCLHGGAVAVIPLLSTGEVLMERQYRHAHGRVMLEIPAGKLEMGEDADPLSAAKRELREETGAVAEKYTDLGVLIPSPAVLSERIFMYLAEDISIQERDLDADEFLDVERVPLAELYREVMEGRISDSKTQIAILKAVALRGEKYGIGLTNGKK